MNIILNPHPDKTGMPYVPPHLRSGPGGTPGGGGRSGGGGGGSGGGGSHFRGDHPPRGGGRSSSSPGDYGGAFGDNRSRGGPGGGGRDFSPSYGGGDPRYDNSRGGGGRGGGYDNDRRGGGYGGGGDRRGNYDNDRRGGYDDRRGGYGGGGYDDRRGGYGGGGGRSPYDDRRGSGGGDPRYGGGAGRPPSARFGSPSPMVGDAQPPSPAPPPAPSDTSAGSSPTQQHGAPTSGLFVEWSPTERVKNLTDEQTNEIRKRLNVTVDQKTSDSSKSVDTLARIAPPVEAFEDMALHPNIVADIRYHDYERPTPIQAQAMPVALSNRDILGCAQTGSGKTAAYSIPMIQHCIHLREAAKRSGARLERGPAGLVLAPTRELAQQIEQECRAFTRSSTGLVRTCIVVGGANMGEQRGELRSGVDIVVATPGRFVDHLQQGNTNLWRVSFVVLDEADRMLDMGFEPQIRDVMGALKERPVPQDNKVAVQLSKSYQTLLFSATMPPEIEELANVYLTDPVQVKVGAVSTPTANVSQTLQKVPQEEKPPELLQVLMTEYVQLYQNSGGAGTGRFENAPLTIIFVERKARCDDIVDFLNEEFEARQAQMGFELRAVALHGGRAQHEREQALNDFTNKRVPILVATDVASRGLDVSGVALVVNFDLPQSFEDYVHRIGRTGRAGTIGKAVSFYTDRDSFVVVQVKRALAELEAGNVHAFQTGKAARQKEKEDKEAFRAAVANGGAAPRPAADGDAPPMAGSGVQILDEKLKHLALFQNSPNVAGGGSGGGAADDAWDD